MEMIDRFFRPPGGSFFLFGPRGTGKSTLVRRELPDALYLDLLDPEVHRSLSARPERLRERLLAEPGRTDVVIDEIQKIPQLLDLVHSLLEEKAGWRFVLTGSSARKLRRGGVDLLAGRALLCSLHPFMASELEDRFSLEEALENGLLPVVLDSDDPRRVLEAYAALYLREEVQMEGVVRNIGPFSRFLEAVSYSHASPLNISNVARECQVGRKTVESYIGVLEDLLLAYRVPVFTRRARRAVVAHPKFYLFDAGVYRSLRPRGPLDRPEEIGGHALEGLVGQHLRAWIDYSRADAELHYWRTRSGVEVDFVVYGSHGLFAIEVKNARRVHPQDRRSLRAFREDYPSSEVFLLHRGSDRLLVDGILCLPCEEFLGALRPGTLPGEGL
ncbi:MAG: ATP-binding protein [Planctomycetota bacterium]